MEKIHVKICIGTTCYMLGASRIMGLESAIPAEWLEKVEISASPCLDLCESGNICKAPFVTIDGDIMSQATLEKVIAELAERLGEPVPAGLR